MTKSGEIFQDNLSGLHSTFLNACTKFMQENYVPTKMGNKRTFTSDINHTNPTSLLGSPGALNPASLKYP